MGNVPSVHKHLVQIIRRFLRQQQQVLLSIPRLFLLEFCNLKFEQGCLNHHKSKNPIKTVSINQSRKPIYKDSIESNLKYKNFNNLFKDI